MIDLFGYGAFFLTTALVFSLITLGLNLQWGLTGLFNVGLAGFVAIGAYTSALLTTPDTAGRFGGFDMPIVVGWLAAMATAGIAAATTGVATLRLKSDYLAITTFGVAVVVQLLTGIGLARIAGLPLGAGWIAHALVLYLLIGLCWLPVVYLQIRMRELARVADDTGAPLLSAYWRYCRIWFWLGVPAFAMLLAVFGLMIFKPA